jgi:PLP dependent protein
MSFSENLQQITGRISAACKQLGKDPARIEVLAVSKTFPARVVQDAIAAGVRQFGENYVQEGVEKIGVLSAFRDTLSWHFIGPLQSNKTREVAEHFDWMHSIDREKIARRLSEQRPQALAPLQVCIQVNVSGEESKSGVSPIEAHALAHAVASLPRLTLRGLMAIPEPTSDEALQRARFRTLAELFKNIRPTLSTEQQACFNVLSMGMSADLEAAIAESIPEAVTMVRIGTALFGARSPRA